MLTQVQLSKTLTFSRPSFDSMSFILKKHIFLTFLQKQISILDMIIIIVWLSVERGTVLFNTSITICEMADELVLCMCVEQLKTLSAFYLL